MPPLADQLTGGRHAGGDGSNAYPAGTTEIDFELQPTSDLRAEIQSHHGEDGALSPLVRRLESLRERGVTVMVACHSSAQAERTRRLLLDRNLMAQIVPLREAAFSPHVHAHLVVGEISAGFVDLHSRLALFSDEDVFGPRAQTRRTPRRPRTSKPVPSVASISRIRSLAAASDMLERLAPCVIFDASAT